MLMDINGDTKMLLLCDLAARLPYGVICEVKDKHLQRTYQLSSVSPCGCGFDNNGGFYGFESFSIKPYLRPMSSMTEEEKNELVDSDCAYFDAGKHTDEDGYTIIYGDKTFQLLPCLETYDWLNAHHFDYRGLIEKGLAIAVT